MERGASRCDESPDQVERELAADRRFAGFASAMEAPLRRALVACIGAERGRRATAAALAVSWHRRERVCSMPHPAAYLVTVGRSAAPPPVGRAVGHPWPEVRTGGEHADPALVMALASLGPRERQLLLLVTGCGWTVAEAASVLGVSAERAERHVARAHQQVTSLLAETVATAVPSGPLTDRLVAHLDEQADPVGLGSVARVVAADRAEDERRRSAFDALDAELRGLGDPSRWDVDLPALTARAQGGRGAVAVRWTRRLLPLAVVALVLLFGIAAGPRLGDLAGGQRARSESQAAFDRAAMAFAEERLEELRVQADPPSPWIDATECLDMWFRCEVVPMAIAGTPRPAQMWLDRSATDNPTLNPLGFAGVFTEPYPRTPTYDGADGEVNGYLYLNQGWVPREVAEDPDFVPSEAFSDPDGCASPLRADGSCVSVTPEIISFYGTGDA